MFVSQYLSLLFNPALIRMLLGDAFRNNSTVSSLGPAVLCTVAFDGWLTGAPSGRPVVSLAVTVTSSSPVYLQIRTSMVAVSEMLSNLFHCPEEETKTMQGCVAANHHQISKRLHSMSS